MKETTKIYRKKYVCILYIVCTFMIANMVGSPVSALTYSDNIGLNFTFNTSLTVSLSSADIIINSLTPGSSSDSNIVDINVVTNNINGYYLTSTVGNNVDAGSNDTSSSNSNLIHNTTNLVHSNPSSNAVFTSLSPNDSIVDLSTYDTSSLTNPNVWGYSYSIDNQSTWSDYSGLPLYNDTTHITTLSNKYVPSNDTINFKIGAKASTTQASGEYTNTINFIITAYPHPMSLADSYAYFNKPQIDGYYTMQDMEPGICAVTDENSELTVIDIRDNNTYTIAKLADGRCWMTTNLNLEGGTEIESTLSDVPEGYTLPVVNGFQEGNRLPESSTEGFSNNDIAYLYNSHRNTPEDCSTAPGCYSYYSWTTATVGSGLSISTDNVNMPYSFCSKNWHLPSTYGGTDSFADFKALTIALGGSGEIQDYTASTNPTGNTMYNIISSSPINFLRSGFYYDSSLHDGGAGGYYWSATTGLGNTAARGPSFNTSHMFIGGNTLRRYGFAIRCIANNK